MIYNKQTSIAVMIITAFIFVVSFGTLYTQTQIHQGTVCSCTLPIPILIPTFSSLGVFVGSLVYYFMFGKIRETEKESTKEARELLDILEGDERMIIKKIVENKGEITQSKLSKSFGKVKTHRILKSLEKRGVVSKEDYGKTNKIKLNGKFGEILC